MNSDSTASHSVAVYVQARGMLPDSLTSAHSRQIALWLARIFATEPMQDLLAHGGYDTVPHLDELFGLPPRMTQAVIKSLPRRLADLRRELESTPDVALREPTVGNLARLAEMFHLSPAETAILTLMVIAQVEFSLDMALRVASQFLALQPAQLMARVLDLPDAEAEAAMDRNSRLMRGGLIQHIPKADSGMTVPTFFSHEFAFNLTRVPFDEPGLFSAMGVLPTPPPSLRADEVSHLQPKLGSLLDRLCAAMENRQNGVNILLHGLPGTGKTQLTRLIGQILKLPVFEFAFHDDQGRPLDPLHRLTTAKFAMRCFQDLPALFVFDAFEDVLASSGGESGAIDHCRCWFNHLLVSHPHPLFWLIDRPELLHPTHARRFDFIIEVTMPSRA